MATLLFSCTYSAPKNESEQAKEEPSCCAAPIKEQLRSSLQQGLRLDFEELNVKIPASKEGKSDNYLDLSGATGQIAVNGLSLHDLLLSFDLPISYNGLLRGADLHLLDNTLYFSLEDKEAAGVTYDVDYKASLTSFDDHEGIDSKTGGVSYFEYGQLDYFLSVILSTLGIDSLGLNTEKETEEGTIVWSDILDSMNEISSEGAHLFRWDLPIGEETYSIGLRSDENNSLSRISFPYEGESGVLSNGIELSIVAVINGAAADFSLPKEEDQYLAIEDSLSLFRKIARYANTKSFGVEGSFTLDHQEDEVIGSDTDFAKDPVDESALLTLNGECDFSEGVFGGLDAGLHIESNGNVGQTLSVHFGKEGEKDESVAYLNVDDVMKIYTPVDAVSALLSSLIEALTDEAIQNELILKLIDSILSTAEAIMDAIDLVKGSAIYQDITGGHYEDVIKTISSLTAIHNGIRIELDLSFAAMDGTATIVLNGQGEGAALAEVQFNDVGITGDNSTKTKLHLNGSLSVRPYETPDFDPTGYRLLSHIPSWDEEIKAIAKHDTLKAKVEGYALTLGTTAKAGVPSDTKYHRSEQGFTFDGSLAFDLANGYGTGEITFTDRKEKYVNDHHLLIDLTGKPFDGDNEQNDMNGSGNQSYMYFEYNSKNSTATSGDGNYSKEGRGEPESSPLKGRFSVHSLNGIIQGISDLTSSTDPRFKRLTNLVSSLGGSTLLSEILSGQYFNFASTCIIDEASFTAERSLIRIKPGFLFENQGLELDIGYDQGGNPKTIEVKSIIEGSENKQTELYVKITLGETEFEAFPFNWSSYDSSFKDYSSLRTLLGFARDTITLGVTDSSSLTTYHITGNATISITIAGYDIKDFVLGIDAWIYLDGTHVKVMAALSVPHVIIAIPNELRTHIFYETDGSDSKGNLFIHRQENEDKIGNDALNHEYKKVKGEDFLGNIGHWLSYCLGFADLIKNKLTEPSSSSSESLHGEDIVKSITVTNASLASPSWKLVIGLSALAHSSLLGDLTANISGKKVTYSDGNKAYSKNALYSLSGNTTIASVLTAKPNLSVSNVSTGTYVDAWNSANGAFLYHYNRSGGGGLFSGYYSYSSAKTTGSADALWKGANGKTSANSNYTSAGWYVTP